jgi:hypothetical protein
MRSVGADPAQHRIEESVIGENDGEIDGWETVPKKKRSTRKNKKPKQEQPPPPPPPPPPQDDYWSEDDLYDLQAPTFGGRQVGSAKKGMRFKAVERRTYQIDKRNRQRNGGR